MTVFSPSALPTSASPMPVLPAVPSTTVPPGWSLPAFSASRMMNERGAVLDRLARVHELGLAEDRQPVSSEARLSLISGVLPIASMMPLR